VRKLVLALLLLTSGCSWFSVPAVPAPRDSAPPVPITGALFFAEMEDLLIAEKYQKQFNFYDMKTLWVRAIVPGMPRTAFVHVSFYTPKGDLFYEQHEAVTTDRSMMQMMSPTMNHLVDAIQAKPLPGGLAIDVPVAITGTIFSRFFEAGTWEVRAVLDAYPETLAAPLEAVLAR